MKGYKCDRVINIDHGGDDEEENVVNTSRNVTSNSISEAHSNISDFDDLHSSRSSDASDLQNGSLSTNGPESTSSNSDMESSTSNDSIASTSTAVPAIFKEYDFNLNRKWDLALPVEKRWLNESECSSLSSIGSSSSSDSEDDEEINVELSPRHYNNTCADEEKFNKYVERDLDFCCRAISRMCGDYWKIVRQLSEERQNIIRILKKRLQPFLRFNDEEEVDRVNVAIEQCESLLNSYFPIVPKWKATYQKDTGKNIIIRKGYIYGRIGESDQFKCVWDKTFNGCHSYIRVDNCETLINGSFCYHNHPAADNEKYTEDVPPPLEAPISLLRVTREGEKWGRFDKLVEFLDQTSIKLLKWQKQAMLCEKRLNLVKQYLNQLEAAEHPKNKNGIRCKMVIAEANNLFKCLRLDKQYP